MHPLHEYVANQLAEKLKARGIVVWYDERGEFESFVHELLGASESTEDGRSVSVAGLESRLAINEGPMFELRTLVEPLVSGDAAPQLVMYLPGCARDRHGSVLMELEKAGTTWEPQLKQLARNLLLQKYTLGVVDEMLPYDRKLSYDDLARAAEGESGAEPPSILRGIFHETSGNDALLAAWIASDARDDEITAKDAVSEVRKLVKARIGLELAADAAPAKMRAVTVRYVLAGEFRLDLSCDPPSSVAAVAAPSGKDAQAAVRELARRLRKRFGDAYASMADRVEAELGLATANVSPACLGSIDTFRFEERALLQHVGNLIAEQQFESALEIVAKREHSFWLDRDVVRKAQWEAARRMAELGRTAGEIQSSASKAGGDVAAWIAEYTAEGGWYRLDQTQRRMESWIANLDEDPDERSLGVVRRAYDDACRAMADGFLRATIDSRWTYGAALHQTSVFSEIVAHQPKPVAYFLVDAMRFEMGVELKERLPKTSEVSLRPAIAALPSITPIGMAALMPGASKSFSVDEEGGVLGVRIDEAFLPDLGARRKFAAARVPQLVDIALDELLSLQPSKLAKRVDGAQVIIVRSQEIDHAGETGFTFQARQIMDTVIDNLARALRKLAAAGVEHAVVTADHGHLFFANDREEAMRTDSPGGQKVELHRRCWIGRGGATPSGTVRVPASALGYDSDLDFVFPTGLGVFKAGGDLAFHHGGPSPQEVVIPVLTIRTRGREVSKRPSTAISVSGAPDAITNRIFSVTIVFGEQQLAFDSDSITVRPLLVSGGKQVGGVGMAVDAELDQTTGTLRLERNKAVTVAFLLSDESAASLRIVVQDPSTDAELYRSPAEIPIRLGVS